VPVISRFFGVVISMYYNDHPPPHFHVRYGDERVRISIDNLRVLDGKMSPRALGLVVEWAIQHRDELSDNWERAQRHEPLQPIAPLE